LSAYDEGLSLPTEHAQLMCLRTQQIVGHETGITRTVDPLAGSYFIESLTDEMECQILALMAKVEEQGGMIQAIRSGWLEDQIADARVSGQRALETGERTVVGVNRFAGGDETPINIHVIRADEWAEKRAEYLRAYRAQRDQPKTEAALARVEEAMRGDVNMIPVIMDALRDRATLGEIHRAMRNAHGFEIDY
ncbi:MAG: methylmalonyl-CoA mutase, partial [Solirubrobacterales bacterium]|nr:methylmalonyl-CoA mutase [Solirubrobacterales bacterium]